MIGHPFVFPKREELLAQAHCLSGLAKLMLQNRDDHGGRTLTEDQLDLVTEELFKASKAIKEMIGEAT